MTNRAEATNPLKLPKEEDILGEYDLGKTRAVLVEITPENREYLARLSVALMLDGQTCRYCGQEFGKEIDGVVYAGRDETGRRFAHGICWDGNQSINK